MKAIISTHPFVGHTYIYSFKYWNKKLLQYDEVDKSIFATYYEYALHFIDSNDKKLTNELVVSINMVLAETATSEKAKLIIRLSIWNFEISDWEAEKIQEVDMHVVNSTKLHCVIHSTFSIGKCNFDFGKFNFTNNKIWFKIVM